MPLTRVALGRGPALRAAAAWLRERHGRARRLDLRSLVVATPGARAGRRLAELLAEGGGFVALPTPTTPGGLPEKLLVIERATAGDLAATLARVAALRAAPKKDFAAVFASFASGTRADGDWFQLGHEIQELHATLSAACLTFAGVAETARGIADPAPWRLLARVQAEYERLLAACGLVDRHAARLEALAVGRFRSGFDLVLVATADLAPLARRAIEGFSASARVTALVHADEGELDLFDALGCFIPARWLEKRVVVPDDSLLVAERPRDQAAALIRRLASLGAVPPDSITVGVGNESDMALIERELTVAGAAARPATGRPLDLSRPGLLLAAFEDLLVERSFESLSALVRHPDVEAFLARASSGSPAALLDEYRLLVLPRSFSEPWVDPPGKGGGKNPVGTRLRKMLEPLLGLVPADAEKKRPLGRWTDAILEILRAIYAPLSLDPETAESLESVIALAREPAAASGSAPEFAADLRTALAILLDRARRLETPRPAGGAAIELLNWLELPLDDAEHLVITGFNENSIPARAPEDPFLSVPLRSALGLPGREERLARDVMILHAILSSRARVTIIAGRRTEEGEPLAPSRLLLLDDDATPARLDRFFARSEPPAAPLFAPRPIMALEIPLPAPRPEPRDEAVSRLHVTAFKRFLACPYTFHLEHVLKLAAAPEPGAEIDHRDFGILIHEILARFGRDEAARRLEDPGAIERYLAGELEREMRARFGRTPRATLRLQAAMIRRRLAGFARWQADETRAGWRIEAVEKDLEVERVVDGTPFLVFGRIDRIERRGAEVRVLDYKTFTSPKTPEQTHVEKRPDGGLRWVDLQLPLYRHLAAKEWKEAEIGLGFVVLPSQGSETGARMAHWSEEDLATADAAADEVIRDVRAGRFWPPSAVEKVEAEKMDAFGRIRMDAYIDRAGVIARGVGPASGKRKNPS